MRTVHLATALLCSLPLLAANGELAHVAEGPRYAWADFDGDGLQDLFVLQRANASALFRNAGDGSFEDASALISSAPIGAVCDAAWQDFDGDQHVDLALAQADGSLRLLRNIEGRGFEDVSEAAGLAKLVFHDARLAWRDYDGDGKSDLELASREGAELFHNRGRIRFERVELALAGYDFTASAPSAPKATSALTIGTHTPLPPVSACAPGVIDSANGVTCLAASTTPTLGLLYPLSTSLFVSTNGSVGVGTTSPSATYPLDVAGKLRASGQIVANATGVAPLAVTSAVRVDNLNADRIDGLDSTAFTQLGQSIEGAEITNRSIGAVDLALDSITAAELASNIVGSAEVIDGSLANADVSASAALAGTKIAPNFGAQDVVTTGRIGAGTASPARQLSVLGYSPFDYVADITNTGNDDGASGLYVTTLGHGAAVLGEVTNNYATGVVGTGSGIGFSTGVAGSSSSTKGALGVQGYVSASSGGGIGVEGISEASDGVGVHGQAWDVNASARGVLGESPAKYGIGVHGRATSTDPFSSAVGVRGESSAPIGIGVQGTATDPTAGIGVLGTANSAYGIGVEAHGGQDSYSSQGIGTYSVGRGDHGAGVVGTSASDFSAGYGVAGTVSNPYGYGVYGTPLYPSNTWAIYADGDFGSSGNKYFVQPHPTDAAKEIRFVCLEGNESGTYFRGSAKLVAGRCAIEVPEEFRLASASEHLTVQATANGARAELWIESKDLDRIVVRGTADVEFDYFVNGLRRGFESLECIRDNHDFVPRVRGAPFQHQMPRAARELLVRNGTLNADFTPNEETAERLGWKLVEPENDPLTRKRVLDETVVPVEKK
ncbi:MAG: VCBS repeat-containing protein [Planctomycetes bacterium]|nr:VCBS repeat-containing protein [Planctomycetota bacterium]